MPQDEIEFQTKSVEGLSEPLRIPQKTTNQPLTHWVWKGARPEALKQPTFVKEEEKKDLVADEITLELIVRWEIE